jgi:hypothetical protein
MTNDYYMKNKERIKKTNKKWREKNQKRVNEKQKKWREKNAIKIKKRRSEAWETRHKWVSDYASAKTCLFCGEKDPACLVFHHRNPEEKEQPVSRMVSQGCSIAKIQKEIEKCDVLCENCHAKLHHQIFIEQTTKTPEETPSFVKWFREYKKTLKCSCGENHPACLSFHHKNPEEKTNTVANLACTHSPAKVKNEIDKCDILCRNCHTKLHF